MNEKPLSGGEVSGVRAEKSEVSDNRSPPTQPAGLDEILDKWTKEAEHARAGYAPTMRPYMLRACEDSIEEYMRTNRMLSMKLQQAEAAKEELHKILGNKRTEIKLLKEELALLRPIQALSEEIQRTRAEDTPS